MDSGELPDADILRRMYWDKGMTVQEISDKLGIFKYHIWKEMGAQGIERRDSRESTVRYDEPVIKTYGDGYAYLVYNDGESRSIKMHRFNALVDHSLDELKGKQVHHRNGVTWLNYPENLEVLTPSEHGAKHAPEPRKKSWADYATPLHFYTEEVMDNTQIGEESPEIRVLKD